MNTPDCIIPHRNHKVGLHERSAADAAKCCDCFSFRASRSFESTSNTRISFISTSALKQVWAVF